MLSSRYATVACSAIAAGAVMALLAALDRSVDTAATVFGVLLALFAGMALCHGLVVQAVRDVNRPADRAFEAGWEQGYDKGWGDAREHDRPQGVTFLQREGDAG
jgi:hypothetical protein